MILAVAVSSVDYTTGYELAFSIFYLLPVAVVAWYIGLWESLLFALGCAIVWYKIELLSGRIYSHPAIGWWNAAVRLGFFSIVAGLLVTVRRELHRVNELSRVDPLTGAPNRRYLYDLVELELERLRPDGRPLTLLYIDLDNFKRVNDTFGHDAGDKVLTEVVAVLRGSLRRVDVVARLGGDEFAVLMPETGPEHVPMLADRLLLASGEAMRASGWPVTFSIGGVTVLKDRTVEQIVQAADALMYEVKKESKNASRHSVLD